MGAKRIIAVDALNYRLEHARKYNGVETVNIEDHDNTGEYIKEITSGGADVVVDCVGMDGRMTLMEKIETALKLQGDQNRYRNCRQGSEEGGDRLCCRGLWCPL